MSPEWDARRMPPLRMDHISLPLHCELPNTVLQSGCQKQGAVFLLDMSQDRP
jgi:hypothetical protein